MEQITDLSELCRLCLEPSSVLIGFETSLYFTAKTIPQLIRFCIDINCEINDPENLLPKRLCQSCLEKLQSTFEFKNKSKESEKYLKEILLSNTAEIDAEEPQITPYNPVLYPPDDDDLLEETKVIKSNKRRVQVLEEPSDEDDEVEERVPDEDFSPKGQRSGNFLCSVCDKSFKYVKAFKTHLKQHKQGIITNGGHKRKYIPKKKKILTAIAYNKQPQNQSQAPYDSISPYESPAPYAPPAREDSPDFAMMMVQSNFLNGSLNNVSINEPLKKTSRSRKQILPSRSPSPEVFLPNEPETTKRSRGRPRKYEPKQQELQKSLQDESAVKRSRGRPRSKQEPKSETETNGTSPFADFTEVDVTSMLRSKSILGEDSVSQSAPSTTQSRSRSPSVEMIQEFDIFGSVIPGEANVTGRSKSSYSSGKTFACDKVGCDRKFHLRVNLRKHQREAHGVK